MIYPLADMVVTLIKKVDIDGGNSTLPLWYPIVAMVYFLVQGLVFVSKGVKGTKFEKKWGRLFDKKRKR